MEPRGEKATQCETTNDAERAGEHQHCHLAAAPRTVPSRAHGAQYGTVTKIELILCPIHLSFRWSTIPLSVFLFLYNEGP